MRQKTSYLEFLFTFGDFIWTGVARSQPGRLLPRWALRVIYPLLALLLGACLAVMGLYGSCFSRTVVLMWLVSALSAFLTSALLLEPLKVSQACGPVCSPLKVLADYNSFDLHDLHLYNVGLTRQFLSFTHSCSHTLIYQCWSWIMCTHTKFRRSNSHFSLIRLVLWLSLWLWIKVMYC